MRVRCAWSVASLLRDSSLSLLSLCATLSSMRLIRFDMRCNILKVQQLVARFSGDVHTDQVHKNVMIECFARNSIIAWASRVAAGEDRTPDLRIMRPTRCQLRYCRSKWNCQCTCSMFLAHPRHIIGVLAGCELTRSCALDF